MNNTQQGKYKWNWESVFLGRKTTDSEREQRREEARRHQQEQMAQTYRGNFSDQEYWSRVYKTQATSIPDRGLDRVVEEPTIKTSSYGYTKDFLKSEDIVVEDISLDEQSKGWVYKIKTKGAGILYYIMSTPTANCQIQSVSGFNQLCQYSDNDIILLLKEGWKGSLKKTLFLLDVQIAYTSRIKDLFESGEILLESPYRNNTGTNMCIWLVQIKTMLERRKLI